MEQYGLFALVQSAPYFQLNFSSLRVLSLPRVCQFGGRSVKRVIALTEIN